MLIAPKKKGRSERNRKPSVAFATRDEEIQRRFIYTRPENTNRRVNPKGRLRWNFGRERQVQRPQADTDHKRQTQEQLCADSAKTEQSLAHESTCRKSLRFAHVGSLDSFINAIRSYTSASLSVHPTDGKTTAVFRSEASCMFQVSSDWRWKCSMKGRVWAMST